MIPLASSRWCGWPLRGVRIGEALKPGPDSVRLLVANTTRWSASWRGLLASDADVWCIQEARVPAEGLDAAQREARRRGLRLQPGAPHEGVHLTAVAHRAAACEVRVEPLQGAGGAHPGRLQHAAVYLGRGRVVHVMNCYGYAGGRADLERNTDLILEGIAWLQSLGGAPALLVGDLNCAVEDTGAAGVLGMAGWRDILAQAGPTCIPSEGEPSRLDYVLANREARDLIGRAELRWDLGLATHAALEVELVVGQPERAPLRRDVAPLDGPARAGWSAAAAGATAAVVHQRFGEDFRQRLAEGDLERAWGALESAMRAWLASRRGLAAPPPRPHAAVEWRAERPPTAGGGGDAASAMADAALLRLRRLRGLHHAQGRHGADARRVAAAVLDALRHEEPAGSEWRARFARLCPEGPVPAAMLQQAEAAWREEQLAARARRRAAWLQWVQEAAANGQGRLYRWVRDAGSLDEALVPDPALDPDAAAQAAGRRGWLLALQGGPAARLRFFEGPWRRLWQRRCAAQPGDEWVRELDGLPAFPERTQWTAGMVRHLLKRMALRKKPGLDAWRVGELRLLPDSLLEWVAQFFEAVERVGSWPKHLREPEGFLLPKPGGGGGAMDRRPIWLLPLLYRLWAAGRAQLVARWRLSWAGADVSLGAEELAWELALELEAAEALDERVAGMAVDWSKAYDHVDLEAARGMLTRAGLPAWLLGPSFSAYEAQRRLRVGRVLGQPWLPTSGLLPGCALAVFFLGVLTLPWLRRTGAVDDRLRCRVYVDDFSAWLRGREAEIGEAVRGAMEVTLRFEEAMDWKLHRGKSVLFANTRELRVWLRRQQPQIATVTCFRDLGVVASAGPARRCAVSGSRVRLAAGRFARIGRLPLPFRERCLMGAAAGTAAGLYGAACGRPPLRELAGLRAAARQAACRGGLRSAAELVLGTLSPSWRLDPEAVVVLAPVWRATQALRRGRFPRELWRAAAGGIGAGGGRGNGPLAAALLSLRRLGLGDDVECWSGVAEAPAGWRPAEKALPDSRRVLLAAWGAAESAAVAGRRAAFAHLRGGIDRWATRRLLERKALEPDAAGALRVVIAGGVVTERVAGKWGRPTCCPHCGGEDEDAEHRFWRCPRWDGRRREALRHGGFADDPAALRRRLGPGVARTGALPLDARLDALAAAARRAAARPVLPAPFRPANEQPRRKAWTDGACLQPTDPLLARAGWGLLLDGPGAATATEHAGPVDGVQTAQRAELTAVAFAVSLASEPLEVCTDSRFVSTGVAALRAGASLVDWAHADLWEMIAPHCRGGFVVARWVKGHTTEEDARARGISAEDRSGNARADGLAAGAARARLPEPPVLAGRAAALRDLEAVQRVLAAVELAAIRANRQGDRADRRRVPRRGAWRRGPRPARAVEAGLGAEAVGAAARAVAPAPRAADAFQALFAGRAWEPHAAAQGPKFVACLRCGAVAAAWRELAARPCRGWAPVLAPRAAAVLLLDRPARAGGADEAFREALTRRLSERPRAPD